MKLRAFVFSLLCIVSTSIQAQQQQHIDSLPSASGWQRLPFPSKQSNACSGLSFLDANHGWVVGEQGAFHTSDGGQSWQKVMDGQYRDVRFFDPNEGWLLCMYVHSVFHTTNGGQSWDTIPIPASSQPYAMQWFNSDTGFVFEGSSVIFRLTRQNTSWKLDTVGAHSGIGITRIRRFDAAHYIAVGGGAPPITLSDDTMKTWYKPQGLTFSSSFYDLLILDSMHAVCFNAKRRTSDRGYSWPYDSTLPTFLSHTDFQGAYGLAVGNESHIFTTSDSGRSWSQQFLDILCDLDAVQIIDSLTAYAIGGDGVVLKTTNGGLASVPGSPKQPLPIAVYPDPSNSNVSITYSLKKVQHVSLSISNAVAITALQPLQSELEAQGEHTVTVSTSSLPSGIYFYSLTSEDYAQAGSFQIIH